MSVNSISTTLSTNNSSLSIATPTDVLGQLRVGSNSDIVLDNIGQVSSSVSVSSTTGYFTNLASNTITNGNTTINGDGIQTTILNATTVNSTNLGGTLSTAAQPNVTSLGTLTSLSVANAASIGSDLNVASSIAVGTSAASRKVISPNLQHGIEVRSRVIATVDYQVQTSDYFVGIQSQENLIITLPDASSLINGQILILTDEMGNAQVHDLIVQTQNGQTIDGQSQLVIVSPRSSISIYTDGQSNFFLF